MKKLLIGFLLLCLPALPAAKEFRAVKLTNVDSRVLFSDEAIAEAMDYLASIGVNVILPVVWNGNQADGVYTLYPSQVMKNLFGQSQHPAFPAARDPLARVIIEAHRNGMEVMPWFEMGFSPAYSQNGGHILARFPDWALENNLGQLVVKNGFDWMSAINPEVQGFIISLVTEVAENYDIDGIEFSDRIPALPVEGGYDAATVAIYQAEHGKLPPTNFRDAAWMRWRADKLTAFNQRVRDSLKVRSPHLIFSSSPSVYPWSYAEYLQDSDTWVRQGVVDNIVPQLYRYNYSDYVFELNKSLSYTPLNKHDIFFAGMLVYLKGDDYLISPEFLTDAIRTNREKGVNGEAFFFYEGLRVQNNRIGNTLKTIYNGPTPVPHRNENVWRPEALIVNENDPGAIVEGNWSVSDIGGFQPKVLLKKEPGWGAVHYFFDVPFAAWFDVFLYNVTGPLATNQARCTLFSENDSSQNSLDQQDLYRKGWQKLAAVYLESGRQKVVRLDNSGAGSGYVVADAAMLLLNRQLSPDVQVTAVTRKNVAATPPSGFWLAQNYPNPFNARTMIQFGLRHSATVELKVINLLAQEMETLVARPLPPGIHEVPFVADHLASGMYICQLRVGNEMQQRKLLLLR